MALPAAQHTADIQAGPPEVFDLEGLRWVRTEIARGSDLVNGKAWIEDFRRRCDQQAGNRASAGGRRALRQVASAGDEPQYWARAGELSNPEKNRLLENLFAEGHPTPGKRVILPTGDEVIFWFNVGPSADVGSPADRVFVTEARCPHQGVCLASGELREIEDIVGGRRPVIRCPRHNRLFDVSTGEGQGNDGTLRRYPARFFPEHRRFYVAVGSTPTQPPTMPISYLAPGVVDNAAGGAMNNVDTAMAAEVADDLECTDPATLLASSGGDDMEVDGPQEPSLKRVRVDIPTPVRVLVPHRTLA